MPLRLHVPTPDWRSGWRRLAGSGIVAAMVVCAAGAQAAAPVDPAAPVLAFHNGLTALSHKDRAGDLRLLRRLVPRSFDVDTIERAVMGPQADKATPAQRARLADVFVRRMAARIEKDGSVGPGAVMTVQKSRPVSDGVWLVSTKSTRGGASSTLTWRVRAEAGGPRIVDVLKDGGSLTGVERGQFQAAMRGRDLNAVITELERTADK
jgi:ABC-type transporter MlaC component